MTDLLDLRADGMVTVRFRLLGNEPADNLAAASEHRLQRFALAHLALIRALQNRPQATTTLLLTRLVDSWRTTGGIAFAEWVAPASHAAALAGRPACELLHAALAKANRHTPWVQAALHTTRGGAATQNDPRKAFASHMTAADIYQGLPDVSDRILALAVAHRSLAQHRHPTATDIRRPIEDFARQTPAPGLLTMAGLLTRHTTPIRFPSSHKQ